MYSTKVLVCTLLIIRCTGFHSMEGAHVVRCNIMLYSSRQLEAQVRDSCA